MQTNKQIKGQSSMEFLFIFGIGLSLILIMAALFFGYFNDEKNSLDREYMQLLGEKIMRSTEEIYYGGVGVRTTVNTKFSEGIQNITIKHMNNTVKGEQVVFDYLTFDYIVGGEIQTLVFEPFDVGIRFNCTMCYHNRTQNVSWYNPGDFGRGDKKIRLENKGDYISIDFSKYYEEGIDTTQYNFN